MTFFAFKGFAALRGFAVLGSSLLLAGCADVPRPAVTISDPALRAIQKRIREDCGARRFSGVVAARLRGRIVLLEACGLADVEPDTGMTLDARFKLFSTSKIFTAATILRLVELGKMRLEDSILAHIPDAPAEWRTVTIEHLLQHTSGVPELTLQLLESFQKQGAPNHPDAMDQVLASLSEDSARLLHSPGSQWTYSNFGYELLAQAAAIADGDPFERVVQRRIFNVAGMRTASLEKPRRDGAELASALSPGLIPGYVGQPHELKPARSLSFVQQGAGAVHASYSDLLAYDDALLRGHLLSSEILARQVTRSFEVNDTVRYGYGWMIRTDGQCTYWHHSGGDNGYVSDFARAPAEEVVVVVLSNFGFAPASEMRRDLMRALLASSRSVPCRDTTM